MTQEILRRCAAGLTAALEKPESTLERRESVGSENLYCNIYRCSWNKVLYGLRPLVLLGKEAHLSFKRFEAFRDYQKCRKRPKVFTPPGELRQAAEDIGLVGSLYSSFEDYCKGRLKVSGHVQNVFKGLKECRTVIQSFAALLIAFCYCETILN